MNDRGVEPPIGVLVVDDAASVRSALSRFLKEGGYTVTTASSGQEALEQLNHATVSLMLLDIRMPDMSGIDVVTRALEIDPDLAILLLTAIADATTAALCMQHGAMGYLTKPIELADLDDAIRRTLRRRDAMLENREISTWLREEVAQRARELERQGVKQRALTVATLEALVSVLEAKHAHTAGHSARIAALATALARELKLPDDEVEQVHIAARLHDLGTIGVRESVLNKAGPLSDEEYEHIKDHVTIGSSILAPLSHLGTIVEIVRGHHERWDGTGYPDGLAGEDIPIGARVIGAVEVYDALTTQRPYQEKLDSAEAVSRMQMLANNQLDPNVMDALRIVVERRQTLATVDEDQEPVD